MALKTTFWRKESKCPEKFLKEYLSAVYRHVYGLNCKKNLKKILNKKEGGGGSGSPKLPKMCVFGLKTTFCRKEKDRKTKRQKDKKTYEFRTMKLNQDEQR